MQCPFACEQGGCDTPMRMNIAWLMGNVLRHTSAPEVLAGIDPSDLVVTLECLMAISGVFISVMGTLTPAGTNTYGLSLR
ncbi:hypothetical protein Pmar_PMAR015830 [Perkinsus marinus ATCC 50983]|uniref:Uncharacterized protein n=1 Tax=Perkinsus marinus (strain ATCC 50983 / TXsc) TaxID=423536 RepID=C5K882_PERM5|nr:hypothetical protein Pmar_PMAR015830 [Perkinsus marinus ATCC 50983]EER19270.1 hypothetical protein Pmar_PMAR015830 [Perkinsus marinus ATCC 50983]|eukprot:XP_002787474.1 hypothetical protein Pmar_PMAR015830 [Perkinsus marinus ATCC 50983]